MADQYTGRVRTYLAQYLSENGLELIDVRFTKEEGLYYLRVFIRLSEAETGRRKALMVEEDEPVIPGVGIDDCVKLSRTLSKWLDREDFIKETYTLEVCSGGFLDDPST